MPEPNESNKPASAKGASADLKAAERGYEDEIARLRSQVRDLQSELARRPASGRYQAASERDEDYDEPAGRASSRRGGRESGRSGGRRRDTAGDMLRDTSDVMRESADVFRDIPARAMDQASKLVRGFTFAYLQQLQTAAEVVSSFTDEVFRRNRPEQSSGRSENRDQYAERSSARARYDQGSDEETDDDSRDYGYDYRSYADRSSRSRRDRFDASESGGQERGGRREEGRGGRREERGRSDQRTTVTGLTANLPRDIYSGLVKAVDRSLDIPSQMVDKFYESYQESDEAEPTSDRRSSGRTEREDDRRRGEFDDDDRDRDSSRSISFEAGREGDEGGDKTFSAEVRTSKREG